MDVLALEGRLLIDKPRPTVPRVKCEGNTQVSHVTLRSFRTGTCSEKSSLLKRAGMETLAPGSHLSSRDFESLPLFSFYLTSFLIQESFPASSTPHLYTSALWDLPCILSSPYLSPTSFRIGSLSEVYFSIHRVIFARGLNYNSPLFSRLPPLHGNSSSSLYTLAPNGCC
jgi:hypothetical protein